MDSVELADLVQPYIILYIASTCPDPLDASSNAFALEARSMSSAWVATWRMTSKMQPLHEISDAAKGRHQQTYPIPRFRWASSGYAC